MQRKIPTLNLRFLNYELALITVRTLPILLCWCASVTVFNLILIALDFFIRYSYHCCNIVNYVATNAVAFCNLSQKNKVSEKVIQLMH